MIEIDKKELKIFGDIKEEFKKLPRKLEDAVKKAGADAASKGGSAQDALRMALGKGTTKTIDQLITGAIEVE